MLFQETHHEQSRLGYPLWVTRITSDALCFAQPADQSKLGYHSFDIGFQCLFDFDDKSISLIRQISCLPSRSSLHVAVKRVRFQKNNRQLDKINQYARENLTDFAISELSLEKIFKEVRFY